MLITGASQILSNPSIAISGNAYPAVVTHANTAVRTYTFPDTTGNVLLNTNVLGYALPSLSSGYLQWTGSAWAFGAGGSISLTNTQVGYGNGSTIVSSANFTYTAGTTSTGYLTIANTTPSTTSATGALVVTGGVGIGGALYSAGNIVSNGGIITSSGVSLSSGAYLVLNAATSNIAQFQFLQNTVMRNNFYMASDGNSFGFASFNSSGTNLDSGTNYCLSIANTANGTITSVRPINITGSGNGVSSVGNLTTSAGNISASAGTVSASGNITSSTGNLVSTAGYLSSISQLTAFYAERTLNKSFTNVANQAFDIILGNNYMGGTIEVEILSDYNSNDATGKIKKLYTFGANLSNSIYDNTSITTEITGTLSTYLTLSSTVVWDATNLYYKIPVYALSATTNDITVRIRLNQSNNVDYTASVLASLSLSAIYTISPGPAITAETHSFPVNITASTASTTASTGAFVVTGGVGIGGALNITGALNLSGGLLSGLVIPTGVPTTTTATLYNNGGVLSWNGSAVGGSVSLTNTQVGYGTGSGITSSSNLTFNGTVLTSSNLNVTGLAYASTVTALSGTSVTINAATSNNYTISPAASTTITFNNPTSPATGQVINIFIVNPSGTTPILAFGTAWQFPPNVNKVLSGISGQRDIISAIYDGTYWISSLSSAVTTGITYAQYNQTMYLGTTAVPINNTSGGLSLAGITLTGSPQIGGVTISSSGTANLTMANLSSINLVTSSSIATSGANAITFSTTAPSTVAMPASTSATLLYYTSAPAAQYNLAYAGAVSGLTSYLANTAYSVLVSASTGAPQWTTPTIGVLAQTTTTTVPSMLNGAYSVLVSASTGAPQWTTPTVGVLVQTATTTTPAMLGGAYGVLVSNSVNQPSWTTPTAGVLTQSTTTSTPSMLGGAYGVLVSTAASQPAWTTGVANSVPYQATATTQVAMSANPTLGSLTLNGGALSCIASTAAISSITMPIGSASYTGTNVGSLWNDLTHQSLATYTGASNANGIVSMLPGVLATIKTTATVTLTTATTYYSILPTADLSPGAITLPANWWVVGKTVRITLYASMAAQGTGTLGIRPVLQGTTVLTATSAALTSGSTYQIKIEVLLTCQATGAAGTAKWNCSVSSYIDIAATAPIGPAVAMGQLAATVATTSSSTLDLQCTMSVGASNPFVIWTGVIEALN